MELIENRECSRRKRGIFRALLSTHTDCECVGASRVVLQSWHGTERKEGEDGQITAITQDYLISTLNIG